ncbi:hypothetical protein [Leucobacter sp. GX24907]
MNELTWEEAKAVAQKKELEIADLIPKDLVVSVDQESMGMMLSCDETRHNWNGATTVTLVGGADIESLVKDIEGHYSAVDIEVSAKRSVKGNYRIQVLPPTEGENYIVVADLEPDRLRIASGSACFTLPEGIYPGGKF